MLVLAADPPPPRIELPRSLTPDRSIEFAPDPKKNPAVVSPPVTVVDPPE